MKFERGHVAKMKIAPREISLRHERSPLPMGV